MKKIYLFLLLSLVMLTSCNHEKELKSLISELEGTLMPLYVESSKSYWAGTTNGNPEDFQRYAQASMKTAEIYSDKAIFDKLSRIKKSGRVSNPLLKRQLDILYLSFLKGQADTTLQNLIIEKESLLEQKYAGFRAEFRGKKVNDNFVENTLRTSTDNRVLEEIWNAHKAIGPYVAEDVLEIVRLRNRLAQSLGFDNYHTMALTLSEQDPEEISALFDELDEMTREGFAALKADMDKKFAVKYKIPTEKLMPWHFQGRFFQEAPDLYPVDFDQYYKGRNLETITTDFYNSIGLNVGTIMMNSDLYPRDGKNQHAYCIDIDHHGDVRVLCNISDNEQWMSTMLHEFGHAVYAVGHDAAGNPLFLRNAAHSFTTEAVAMLFERMSRNTEWMKVMVDLPEEEAAAINEDCIRSLRLQQLVFSRWTQVMYRFEKEMYADPEQDLNTLWWDLVEKYQLLNRPEGRNQPDWASKIHVALYPCYYHNYQLGALLASQLHHYIVTNVTKSQDMTGECYIGNKVVGEWLMEYVFTPGMRYEWNDMIEKATGEKLTAAYYKMQFVD
ncbi:MAG: peptidase M3 [Bacteroidales bacterium]|nr:peptidase M3 [Bacteroidales bacterium]